MTYASFWKRTAAYLIDGFIYGIISYGVSLILNIILALVLAATNEQYLIALLVTTLLSIALYLGVYLAYYVWPETSSWQATIGKKLFGLKVTDINGQRISFWRSLGRNLGMIISTLILDIGFLMCLWTEKKQCLHDQMASCLVVDETPDEKQGCAIGVIVAFVLMIIAFIAIGVVFFIAMQQNFPH